ncbi:MAG: citrate synthase [Herpetosiphonaceae bacterium]|nr:MAG: citrate synthase [Herpetosiphonaceae bacterium]
MADKEAATGGTVTAKGLEGVTAGSTALSLIEGQVGRLSYRGYDINDLANNASFEEVCYLLWFGDLPTRSQLVDLGNQLRSYRELPGAILDLLRLFPHEATPMDVLRTAVSALSMFDPDAGDGSREANIRRAMRLTAQFPTIVAAFDRIRNRKEPLAPNPALGHAANFLYMLTGEEPAEKSAHILDIALVLHADHGFNASTFAARVAAGTLADMYSAITAAIGTLKGPLHGGANEQVMRTLLSLGAVDKVRPFVEESLTSKRKIMGFGHRVYKADDPRAIMLRELSRNLAESTGNRKWFEMSERMRETMEELKPNLPVNVDFYSASVYYTLGIPVDLFTPVFAISRVSGWTAHVLEQYADNRLIRPDADYIGPRNRDFKPVDER